MPLQESNLVLKPETTQKSVHRPECYRYTMGAMMAPQLNTGAPACRTVLSIRVAKSLKHPERETALIGRPPAFGGMLLMTRVGWETPQSGSGGRN